MKKSFCLFTIITAVAVSCTRDDVRGVASVSEGELVTLRVGVSVPATRVSGSSLSEDGVKSLQVFVFNEDGVLEKTEYNDTGEKSVEIDCFPGQKDVVAILNAHEEIDWFEVDTVDGLNDVTTRLDENGDGGFFMYGRESATVPNSDGLVNVNVSRRAARVVLKSVANGISSSSSVGDLVLNDVYLVNVVGDAKYDGSESYTPTEWYNSGKLDSNRSGSVYGFLYDGMGDITLASGNTYTTEHFFYCYPNLNAGLTDVSPTRLVVEATLNKRKWYYPITLKEVESNCSYEIDLTITGAGASTPDSDPQVEDFLFKVTIASWDEVPISETI